MSYKKHIPIFFVLIMPIVLLSFSCSTVDKEEQQRLELKKIEKQRAFRKQTTSVLDSLIQGRIKDQAVERYLLKLTKRLSTNLSALKQQKGLLELIPNQNGKWVNYALPGYKLYFSAELLKEFQFENVLAAAIAEQLLHINSGDFVKNIKNNRDAESILKALSYTHEQNISTTRAVVQMLYNLGYDPRGVVKYWEIHLNNRKYSPYSKRELYALIKASRDEIFNFSPLRNPIVRSTEFVDVYKRIQKL